MAKKKLSAKKRIIGTSLNNLKELVIHFARSGKNILLIGASGTGKELFAELYCNEIGRKFAPINCSGISDTVLSSELFGHIKGAYTGAHNDRSGILSNYGKRGVIFLDEIGSASPSFQAAILRVLQTGDYKPVGSDEFVNIRNINELRIIAASLNKKNLREDLVNRFHIFYIPDLHERKEDIPDLIKEFCKNSGIQYISCPALDFLKDYHWPGNVRELETVLEKAIILCERNNVTIIKRNDFPSIYFDQEQDNSKKVKIAELKATSLPFEDSFFLKDPSPSYPQPRLSLAEAEFLTYFNDEEYGPKVESLLRRKRDKKLISILDDIGPMLKTNFAGLNKSLSLQPTFENTTPEEWENFFYEYHVKQGRGGVAIEKLFEGRINNKTAGRHLKEAKKRLKTTDIKNHKQ